MSVRRVNGQWIVDFWLHLPSGERRRIREKSPLQSKPGALEYERKRREALLSGKIAPPLFEDFSKEFVDVYSVNNNKPRTVEAKRDIVRLYLAPTFNGWKLDEIGFRDIEVFKSKLSQRVSTKTVNNALTVLGKMLRYANEVGVLPVVPRVKLFPASIPDADFLTFEEAERLLEAAAKDREPVWFPFCFLALKTGLRFGELIELRWSDLDLEKGLLRVRRSWTTAGVGVPKSGKGRDIPLTEKTCSVLRKLRGLHDLVLCYPDGSRLMHSRARDALARVSKRASLRPIMPHLLRHTFASHLVMRGRSLLEVQELLGHSDYTMTLRYAHLAPDVKKDAISVLDSPAEEGTKRGLLTPLEALSEASEANGSGENRTGESESLGSIWANEGGRRPQNVSNVLLFRRKA